MQRLDALFAAEPDRLSRLSFDAAGIYFDWSKTHLDQALIDAFVGCARRTWASPRRATRCSPASIVNPSEDRAATHVAERGNGAPDEVELAAARRAADARADRRDRGRRVRRCHRRAPHRHRRFGARPGAAGRCAGPRRSPALKVRFLSNIDGAAFDEAVEAARSGDDAGRRRVEDLHHARDAGQSASGARLARAKRGSTIRTGG